MNYQTDFVIKANRLGYISAYARKVLLGRHFLRVLGLLANTPALYETDGDQLGLELLRVLLHSQQPRGVAESVISAPYFPAGRPTSFSIAMHSKYSIATLITDRAPPAILFHNHRAKSDLLLSSVLDDDIRKADDFLIYEIEKVTKSTNLSTKKIVDERCERLISTPLWPRGFTTPFTREVEDLFAILKRNDETAWLFWEGWYADVLAGTDINWELTARIAQISNDVWQKGSRAVAAEIAKIKATLLKDSLPQAETVEIDPNTGLFIATPISVQNAPLLGALLSRVTDSLDDALQGNNALNDRSREVKVLERTLSRYSNDPQRIEMDFTSISVGLRRQMNETGDLPQSEDNRALLEALEDAVKGIRASHPDVAENRITLAQQAMKELPEGKVDLLKDAKPVLIAMSHGRMAEGFSEDIPELINDALQPLPSGAPPLPGADVSTRIFSRVSSMTLNYDKFIETGAKVFDSKTFKTVRLGLTVSGLLSALVSLGLFLFGVI